MDEAGRQTSDAGDKRMRSVEAQRRMHGLVEQMHRINQESGLLSLRMLATLANALRRLDPKSSAWMAELTLLQEKMGKP